MLLLLAFDEFYSLCSFYFVDNTKEIRISRSSQVGYITSLHFPAKYNSSTVSNTYRYVLLNPYGRIEVKLTDWDLLPGSTFNVSDLWVTRNSRTKCWALCCCYWTFPIFGLNMRIIMFISYIEKYTWSKWTICLQITFGNGTSIIRRRGDARRFALSTNQ